VIRLQPAPLAVVLAVALLSCPAVATAADALPDLRSAPPSKPELTVDMSGEERRLLLRFDAGIDNVGAGAVELRGERATTSDPMVAVQRVFGTEGAPRDEPRPTAELAFETGDGHHHWHFQGAARYALVDEARTAEIAPSAKVGFCLQDSVALYGSAPRTYAVDCAKGAPETLTLVEGISPGWRDVYDRTLAFQWVDVSDVQPGRYWLHAVADPDGVLRESDEGNQAAYSDAAVTVPGHAALPQARGVPVDWPTQVTLGARAFGAPGAPRFRIETPPEHGTLDVAAGTAFDGPAVTYRPHPGYRGPDRFTFVALDDASRFPRRPAPAAVTLDVGGERPAISIAGAPASLEAGRSVQLRADVAGDDPATLAWSADAGAVSPGGLYTAPVAPPPSGAATVTARTARGGESTARIAILPAAQTAQPAPLPAVPPRARAALGRLTVAVVRRRLVASVRPGRAGVVRISAFRKRGGRRIGTCRARVPRGRAFTCRIRLGRTRARGVRVVATLTVRGRVVARRVR
jgi:hypothetical protein